MCDQKACRRSIRWETRHNVGTSAKGLDPEARRVSKCMSERKSLLEARGTIFLAKGQKGQLDILAYKDKEMISEAVKVVSFPPQRL